MTVDQDYYLGSSDNWKDQLQFLPGVVDGIKCINAIQRSHFAIVSNQAGVALGLLTEARMNEVHKEMVARLEAQGAHIDSALYCPFVDSAYVEKAKAKGRTVRPDYVDDKCPDLKPKPGMLYKAAALAGVKLEDITAKFMIGDRLSDIEMGIAAGCYSILIPSYKTRQLGDYDLVIAFGEKHPGKVYAADNFDEAAKIIEQKAFLLGPHK